MEVLCFCSYAWLPSTTLSVFVSHRRVHTARLSTCSSAEHLHHRRGEETNPVRPSLGVVDVAFPPAVRVLLKDLTPTNHECASVKRCVHLWKQALATQQFTITLKQNVQHNDCQIIQWCEERGLIKAKKRKKKRLFHVGSALAWSDVCDSSRNAFVSVTRVPMSWKSIHNVC